MKDLLGHYLEMRNYPAFEKTVENFLKRDSWEELLVTLREVRAAEVLAPGWEYPLGPGKMRDGMIELLRLREMQGLDFDFLHVLTDIDGNNLDEIRKAARKHCISLLRDQIRGGNTFFIDAEAMKETDLTILIPGIIEARIKEVEALTSKPPLSEVYSTYYGFSILTSGGLSADWGGIPPETKSQLNEVMQDLGNVENISAKQLKFSYLSFSNCSDYLKTLLWNLLKMCIGGIKSQRAGIEFLGGLGDSRALHLMHQKLENVQDRKIKEALFHNIGSIGSSESFDTIYGKTDGGANLDAVKALGLIRDSRIMNVLRQYMGRFRYIGRPEYLVAFGNTRDDSWLSFLYQQRGRRARLRNASIDAIRKIEGVRRYQRGN
jgi:hypothetical protein